MRKTISLDKKYIAAVDMGTNSFHLIIAEIMENGTFKVVDREREVIRLGSHKGEDLSLISEDEAELSIKILAGFKKLAQSYGAELRAIATSAVRESTNKTDYTNLVRDKIGVNVEIIEGKKEAGLIFLGAKKALGLHDKNSLCIDIGGGSTELVFAERGELKFAESIKIGAVRLSKKYFPDYIISDELISECREYIDSLIKASKNIDFKCKYDIAVGSSGTIQSVAKMVEYFKTGKTLRICK